ncbi:unnamed protein product, partial [marine sediment metagenome]
MKERKRGTVPCLDIFLSLVKIKIMRCILDTPLELNGDFEFSEIECETQELQEIYELIQNPTYPERQFFVQKTLTYGEAIIIW